MSKYFYSFMLTAIILLTSGMTVYSKSGLDLIPFQSETLFHITMNRSKLNTVLKNPKVSKTLNKIKSYGINIYDVQNIYGSMLAQKNKRRQNLIIVGEGKFNQQKIYGAIMNQESRKMVKANYGGYAYLKAINKKQYSVAVLGQFFILAKNRQLKQSIDLYRGKGKSVRHNSLITNNIASVQRGNLFWVIARIGQKAKKQMFNGQQYASLMNIETISMSYTIGGVDLLVINSMCRNGRDVADVKKAMKEYIDMNIMFLAMSIKDKSLQDSMMKLAEGAKYFSRGKIASVQIEISQSLTNQLIMKMI